MCLPYTDYVTVVAKLHHCHASGDVRSIHSDSCMRAAYVLYVQMSAIQLMLFPNLLAATAYEWRAVTI